MNIKSGIELTGRVKIDLVYPSGEIVNHYDGKNLITLSAKQALLSMLYLSSQTSDPITKLAIGTGGTIDPEGQFPKSVASNLTSLFNQLLMVNTSYTVNNSMPSVTFIADVDQGTANGDLISEVALYKTSNLMFNIKTFPGIPKTSEFAIHFTWTIDLS